MFFDELCQYMNECGVEYEINANIAQILSFRVGGLARLVIYPNTVEEFCKTINFLNGKIKFLCFMLQKTIFFLLFRQLFTVEQQTNDTSIVDFLLITVENSRNGGHSFKNYIFFQIVIK